MRDLRRYAASLSRHGLAATSLARAIASLRAFYRTLREHGEVAQNPAELLTLPKRPRALPHVLRPDELASLLDRIAATTPLDRATARCSSSPTPPACAPRSWST